MYSYTANEIERVAWVLKMLAGRKDPMSAESARAYRHSLALAIADAIDQLGFRQYVFMLHLIDGAGPTGSLPMYPQFRSPETCGPCPKNHRFNHMTGLYVAKEV